jgi:hypothetical protein
MPRARPSSSCGDGPGRGRAASRSTNYRSEGRSFTSGRCLIVADGFYEFTAPKDPAKKRKDKWLFTLKDHDWFCIAGLWRKDPQVGEAYTMLTAEPGPDVAPYHSRGIAVLGRDGGRTGWTRPSPRLRCCSRFPAGSLWWCRSRRREDPLLLLSRGRSTKSMPTNTTDGHHSSRDFRTCCACGWRRPPCPPIIMLMKSKPARSVIRAIRPPSC